MSVSVCKGSQNLASSLGQFETISGEVFFCIITSVITVLYCKCVDALLILHLFHSLINISITIGTSDCL